MFSMNTNTTLDMIDDLNSARNLLREYLDDFPEHDQGDCRVFDAYELIARTLKQLEVATYNV